MPGRSRRPPSPGRRALKIQLDQVLKAAAGLDRIEAGVGDRLCHEAAAALRGARSAAIRKSESETNSEARPRPY